MGSSDNPQSDPVLDAIQSVNVEGIRAGVTTPLQQQHQRPRISLRDHEKYISLTMEFRCNLKCVHCMIEGTMDDLQPTPDQLFQQVLEEQRRSKRWEGLVLTGSEITLHRDLPKMAERARHAGFDRVRIQTHGMRLGKIDFADTLLDAGVNEFFISVAGAGAVEHDKITQVQGAWDRMLAGMKYLDGKPDIKLLTNTVVTSLSFRQLPEIVTLLGDLKSLVQMEFWNYWPMSENDEKQLCAAHMDILPYLREAIHRARDLGRYVEVKNFPECLLTDFGDAIVNAQPTLVIDPAFWKEFDRNGFYQCRHKEQCASTECLGLNTAYIERFGWESEILSPITKQTS